METQGQSGVPYGHLEELLKKNLEVAEANHKILRRMERNALIGFVAKIVIWLLVLGVPIFFLSSYLAPLLSAVSGGAPVEPAGIFGLPSAEQLRQIFEAYRAQK
ncbi:MAG: hypothetical protein AAB472_01245 [Patescibacteria group bacterium]